MCNHPAAFLGGPDIGQETLYVSLAATFLLVGRAPGIGDDGEFSPFEQREVVFDGHFGAAELRQHRLLQAQVLVQARHFLHRRDEVHRTRVVGVKALEVVPGPVFPGVPVLPFQLPELRHIGVADLRWARKLGVQCGRENACEQQEQRGLNPCPDQSGTAIVFTSTQGRFLIHFTFVRFHRSSSPSHSVLNDRGAGLG